MTASAADRGLQDVALLFDLFRASGLTQLDLRTPNLEFYVARGGVRRRAAVETPDPAIGEAPLLLKAPHVATLVGVARAGERVAAGSPWATISVLGVETGLTHDADIIVRGVLAAPGILVEYGATVLEAEPAAAQPATVAR